MVIMMEESNIFLAGGDAVVHLAEPVHRKNSAKLFQGNLFIVRTYLMTDFLTPFPLYAPVYIFDDLPFILPVSYVLNGWPISQPKNK